MGPLLTDIQNAVQVPLSGPFDHRSIEWSRNYRFLNGQRKANAIRDITYIPWDYIEDYIREGEE